MSTKKEFQSKLEKVLSKTPSKDKKEVERRFWCEQLFSLVDKDKEEEVGDVHDSSTIFDLEENPVSYKELENKLAEMRSLRPGNSEKSVHKDIMRLSEISSSPAGEPVLGKESLVRKRIEPPVPVRQETLMQDIENFEAQAAVLGWFEKPDSMLHV